VVRRCQTAGAKAAPYTVAGRCLIIRVDDPGVVPQNSRTATAGRIRNASNTPRP
jgi:hypothetical protein